MLNNSMKTSSRKFVADMKAPSFNQKDILLEEAKELNENINKLFYSNSDQKAQLLKDIKVLNESIKQARIEEYTLYGQGKQATNRFQDIVMTIFLYSFIFTIFYIFVLQAR